MKSFIILSFVSLFSILVMPAVAQHLPGSVQRHIFFFHNRFIEEHNASESHPEYGKAHYAEILSAFEKSGFVVHSEKRPPQTDVKIYARRIVQQIDSLILSGVSPNRITVIGTSKGGYIAQYVSTYLANPDVNYVFVGSYMRSDLENFPDIQYCGSILTIYEKTDQYGVSALDRKLTSTLKIPRFQEIQINTGLRHGFLFRQLDDWVVPCLLWAAQMYEQIDK